MGGKWKNLTIHVDDSSPHGPKACDELLSKVMTYEERNYQDAAWIVFRVGMEQKIQEYTAQGKDMSPVVDLLREHDFIIALNEETERYRQLEKAYRTLGPEKFMDVALKKGISLDEVEHLIRSYSINTATSWYEQVKRWLIYFVQQNGERSVEEVKGAAIQCGLLADPSVDKDRYSKEWDSIKNCASELGLSSRQHRGYWRAISESDQLTLQ